MCIKKETNSPHHSNKMAIGFGLANFRFQVLKVNLVFLLWKYYKVTRRVLLLLLLLFFLTKKKIKLQLNLTAGDWMFPNSYKAT